MARGCCGLCGTDGVVVKTAGVNQLNCGCIALSPRGVNGVGAIILYRGV